MLGTSSRDRSANKTDAGPHAAYILANTTAYLIRTLESSLYSKELYLHLVRPECPFAPLKNYEKNYTYRSEEPPSFFMTSEASTNNNLTLLTFL